MNNRLYIIVLVVFIFLSSCTKKFLEVNNTEKLFQESYVKDLTTMQEYLRGLYYHIVGYDEGGSSSAIETSYAELAADNLRPFSATSAAGPLPVYNWTMTSSDNRMTAFWLNSYQSVRMCNFLINNIDKYRNENTAKVDDMKGQALATRALLYFRIVSAYAQHYTFTPDASHIGVPYILTDDITKKYSRQSVAEVYAGMIADLTNAIPLMPLRTDTRFMNQLAAKALLARIYLFKGDFTNSKALALEVTNAVPLMTTGAGYPNDIFKFKSPSATEVLFQLSPYTFTTFALGRYVMRSPITLSATSDIATIIKENPADARSGWTKDTVVSGTTLRLVKKFPLSVAPEVAITFPDLSYYPPVLRSSEMFLTVAEAAAMTNDETTARTYLNNIRKRANPSIADVTATGGALLDSIYKERRKELAFEGLRLYDLMRWKQPVNRTDVLGGSPAILSYPNNRAISPISLTEIQASGIPQNTGY